MKPAVFIAGAPRSGTSLLYKLLCLHPDSAWISNWLRRAPGITPLAGLNRLAGAADRTRQRVWFGPDGQAYAYNRSRSLAQRLFPQPVEGEPVFARYHLPEASTQESPTPRQSALRGSIGSIGRFGGGATFISKRIAHNRRLPLLHGIFPDSRVIVLTRDGRAVAASLRRVDWWPDSPVWWYGGTPREWEAAGRDPWELCARHWVREVEEIERGLAVFPGALRIRYEDLLADPGVVLDEIAGYCGLAPDRRWRDAVGGVAVAPAAETWRAQLGSAADTVERIQAEKLRAYGYLP
ncbi:MAG TPA: sulfotransferase [Mycobacteriales bacterium]|nr:sulfotransferase [Mycobacteriales bacterium]